MSQIFWQDIPAGGDGRYPLLSIDCSPYTLDLRHQWTTSHSSTAQRTNALFTVKVEYVRDDGVPEPTMVIGYGEVGMPPKNPSAGYYAEYSDVAAFAQRAVGLLNVPSKMAFPIQKAHHLVASVIMAIEEITQETASKCGLQVECMERFGKSGLQMALLDVLGQLWAVPVWCVAEAWTRLRIRNVSHNDANITQQIDGVETAAKGLLTQSTPTGTTKPVHHAGYLTVSMNTPHEMAVNTLEALVATPFIKVKLDGNTPLSWERLTAMAAAILDVSGNAFTVQYASGPSEGRIGGYRATLSSRQFKADSVTLVIDANAAWSPEGSVAFIDLMKTATDSSPEGRFLKRAIKLLEQPFPTSLVQSCADALEAHPNGGWVESSEVLSKWAALKGQFEEVGVLVFADESATVLKDLPTLCPFIHGVNIKLEKCGGILSAFHICHAVLDKSGSNATAADATVSHPPSIVDLGKLRFAWIGTMVSSRLGCNGAAQLLYLTGQGDVDGSLLVTEKCQVHSGGFGWPSITECGGDVAQHGRIALSTKSGLGCPAK